MEITQNKAVALSYRFYEAGQAEIGNQQEEMNLTYLHGVESVLPGIAEALEGKKAGDKVELTLTPDQAYGERQDYPIERVPIKHLVHPPKRIRPGMVVRVAQNDGHRDVTVVKAGKFNVDVDLNHPFAGKTLTFEMTVVDVRDATESELAHGHAHGVGGHHH